MSSCLSGGGRTYGFDLEIVKSPSTSIRTSHTSSPSSTISESSNSPLAICTRKPRTRRKRLNQIYNEAAALLSTAYPSIFTNNNLTTNPKPSKPASPCETSLEESSELLLSIRAIDEFESGFLLQEPIQDKPNSQIFEPKFTNWCEKSSCQSPGEMEIQSNPMAHLGDFHEDFDAESILDEEMEGGIDSIMGIPSLDEETLEDQALNYNNQNASGSCYGNQNYNQPMGLGLGLGLGFEFGFRKNVSAWRRVDEVNWRDSPIVDVGRISPKFNTNTNNSKAEKKKKKVVEKISKVVEEVKSPPEFSKEENQDSNAKPKPGNGPLLKLNYGGVLDAWSGRDSPFSDDNLASDVPGNDVAARLAQIDLFWEGGMREASVQRYKEKRRARLFSKKIRYQVRKVNADKRPRMKGRFVRRSNSSLSSQR